MRALVVDERDAQGVLVRRRSTGYVVGLTGPWGAGKSSVINLLAAKLGTMDRVIVTTLNPWLFNGRDELLSAFFSSLRNAMGRSGREQVRDLVGALDRYQEAVGIAAQVAAAYADVQGGGGKVSAWVKAGRRHFRALLKRQRELSAIEERAALEKKIASSASAIVVLVDELDRVEDTDVKAVAQLVKAVGDIQGISYLVAYDPERVIDALGRGSASERAKTGAAYLEKVIQHPIPLRPLFEHDVHALIHSALSAADLSMPEVGDQNGQEILDEITRNITTPREIKRLVGAYSIINRMTREELYPYDVLGYCWIITKTPSLRESIVRQMGEIIDDPTSDESWFRVLLSESGKEERTPISVLGNSATEHARLLRLLFPALEKDQSREVAGDRISRRRNLVRLLYLGDPPGSFSRHDVDVILRQNATKTAAAFRDLIAEDKLSTFLDRVADSVETLPSEQSDALWLGLADSLVRDHDWLTGPEPQRGLADDAQNMLLTVGRRGAAAQTQAKRVVEILIEHGDLIIVPGFLRRHMFQHGLVKETPARRGDSILDDNETKLLFSREVPRYIAAIVDGHALRRLTDVEAFFVVKNGGLWTRELFESLTNQLSSPEAIQTFAGLFVPPGYIIDKPTLDEMFETEAVLSHVLEYERSGMFTQNPWVLQSVKRLRLVLQGRDPHFSSRED